MNSIESTIGPQSAHNRDLNGILVINKPKDWTSHDVVAKIRGKFKLKKVGHTGTLDPNATGVLVLCIGKATKIAEYLIKEDKEYEAEITFGATSETDDGEGEIVQSSQQSAVSNQQIENALKQFEGTYDQLPPAYSAKKVKGQKAYEAARKGKPLKLEPSSVTVHSIQLLKYEWPKLIVRISCGSGFYVRSLARDLGKVLGVGGYLSELKRTSVGRFKIDEAFLIDKVQLTNITPLASMIPYLPGEARLKIKRFG